MKCSKIPYATRAAARQAIKDVKIAERKWHNHQTARSALKTTRRMRLYLCPRCELFHLTTMAKKRKGVY